MFFLVVTSRQDKLNLLFGKDGVLCNLQLVPSLACLIFLVSYQTAHISSK